MSEPLVIVGNGMAAARLVDELAKVALGRYAIAVIGDEPRLACNRLSGWGRHDVTANRHGRSAAAEAGCRYAAPALEKHRLGLIEMNFGNWRENCASSTGSTAAPTSISLNGQSRRGPPGRQPLSSSRAGRKHSAASQPRIPPRSVRRA